MPDYTVPSGEGGIIMIRDNGTTVQFMVQSGNPSFFKNAPGISWGSEIYLGYPLGQPSYIQGWFTYPTGSPLLSVATFDVKATQTMRFTVGSFGPDDADGTTSIWATVHRAVPPPPPTVVEVTDVTANSLKYKFASSGDSGSPILESQIGYGYSSATQTYKIASTGTTVLSNLTPASTVYIWSRQRNAIGWGDWSERMAIPLGRAVKLKKDGVWANGIPYVKSGGLWIPAKPYVKTGGVWKSVAK